MESQVADAVTQFLTFKLDQELFAMEVSKVREVLEFNKITKVPRTPSYMRGVINLRGNVVPVVDLRLKLGLEPTQVTVDTCVVISEIAVDGECTVLGTLVDSVQEVINLEASHVAPPPRLGKQVDSTAIRAMGKRDDQFIMILDLDRIFSLQELRASVGECDSPSEPISPDN
jgi:purine-binding chemotaxis protein CheW